MTPTIPAAASRALCALVGLALLTACGSTPPSRFYVLSAGGVEPRAEPSELAVRVERVRLPASVNRPQIVTRVSDHELDLAEFHRWAEPLDVNMTRVLAADLQLLLGGTRVYGPEDRIVPPVDATVAVEVLRLSATLGESLTLSARWNVAGTEAWLGTMQGTYRIEEIEGSDHAAIVAALSSGVGQLARDIVASLDRLVDAQSVPAEEGQAGDG